jgi:hypothetical protein
MGATGESLEAIVSKGGNRLIGQTGMPGCRIDLAIMVNGGSWEKESVKLPEDVTIAPAKLNRYLLIWRPADDKSKFLASAGYTIENWPQLEADLRCQILPLNAVLSRDTNRFGQVYAIYGNLVGPNGMSLAVVTIWMMEFETGVVKFITLYPDRES